MYKNKSKLYFYAIISLLALTNISGLLYSNDVNATDVHTQTRNFWTKEKDNQLITAVTQYKPGEKVSWVSVAKKIPGKDNIQCRRRWKDTLDPNLKKGPWTKEEDDQLIAVVVQNGTENWSNIAEQIPGRSGKQCRERWVDFLDPNLKKGPWTKEEDEMLLEKYNKFGSKWANIKNYLPGRSQNATKNRFHSLQRKRTTLDSLQNTTDVDNNAPRNIFAGQNMMAPQAFFVPNQVFFAPTPNYVAHIQAPVAVNLPNIVNIPVANPIVIQEEEMEDDNANVNNNALVGQNMIAALAPVTPVPNTATVAPNHNQAQDNNEASKEIFDFDPFEFPEYYDFNSFNDYIDDNFNENYYF